MNRRRGLLLGAVAFAASTGWVREPRAAGSRRLVSVGGALTETVYALGAQGDLVGVDTTSLFPEAAKLLPSVGYARALSAEGVLSLAPTLVVATEDAGPPVVLRQLEAARIAVQVLASDHRFEGVLERTARLAALTGRDEAGRVLVERLRNDWQAVRQRVAARRPTVPLRVLFVLSHTLGQVRVAGQDTSADAMIGYAGAANAMAGGNGFSGYKALTPESAIAAAPDVILATDQGLAAAGGVAGLLKLPGLAQTPAGRAQRVIALEALWLLGFGPRMPQAVAALADALYPARPAS